MKKKIALLMACVMAFGVAVGGTLAWLTDDTAPVVNTFTDSDINITLTETDTDPDTDGEQHDYQMIPGHTITKDPKVTVVDGSEDCWLFVKVTESTSPDLDAYISYAIADGWTTYKLENESITEVTNVADLDTIILGRKVYKNDTTKEFGVIGYTNTNNEFVVDKVLVNDSVDKTMMESIKTTQPTLTFAAAAVQLYKSNGVEFPVAEAYAKAEWPAPANP